MKFTPQKFDELLELAQTDPEALEKYRAEQIQSVIDEAPEYLRHRLQGLQFQIDAQRQIHRNPLGACIKLTQMMSDSAHQLQDMLCQLTSNSSPALPGTSSESAQPAKVLAFPARP